LGLILPQSKDRTTKKNAQYPLVINPLRELAGEFKSKSRAERVRDILYTLAASKLWNYFSKMSRMWRFGANK
jgi:hypothetical protein